VVAIQRNLVWWPDFAFEESVSDYRYFLFCWTIGESLTVFPKETSTHLALAALRIVNLKGERPTPETLQAAAQSLLPPGTELPEEEWANAVGEV
jgi:hypothetical protein